ncbi:MAG: hypothetical protein AAGU27_06095 [Dehalobacterium sp.]
MVGRMYLWLGGIILAPILAAWFLFSSQGSTGLPIYAAGDLDGDGRMEEYLLVDHCLTVQEGEQDLWKSPREWSIDNFVLGDVDNDGTVNLSISLWKTGSFGEIRPFWLTGEDTGYKNHLFVFKLIGNTFKSAWCSSDLDCPIISFVVHDVNGDGLNELVVEEGQYRKTAGERYTLDADAPVRTTVWQWEEWGFSRTNL